MAKIFHCLWFDGQAEEAAKFYTSIFKTGKIGRTAYYGKWGFKIHGMPEGSVLTVEFEIEGQKYLALNGGKEFKFNESISIIVSCKDQKEIDYYWKKLSADPNEGVCGWLKDKYGVSWQIVPEKLEEMRHTKDKAKYERVMKKVLKMKKLNIAELEKAFNG